MVALAGVSVWAVMATVLGVVHDGYRQRPIDPTKVLDRGDAERRHFLARW